MKRLFIPVACISALFFSLNANAQTPARHLRQDESKDAEKNTAAMINNTPVVTQRKTLDGIESSRKTLTGYELSRLPVRDINAIANTVAGVQSYGGGTPSIKGAPASGTAYFVDGVRVHGSIPNSVR